MSTDTIHHSHDDGVHVIAFTPTNHAGQESVRRYFADRFLADTAESTRLVVDLSEVASLDSSCLGPLVQRLRDIQEQGGRMALCGVASQGMREVFALTRFDKIFTICPNRTAAITAVSE